MPPRRWPRLHVQPDDRRRGEQSYLRAHIPVAVASGTVHLGPSFAPLEQTNETSISSSPQFTDPVPIRTRKLAARPGSP
jgi:hypothetical protein